MPTAHDPSPRRQVAGLTFARQPGAGPGLRNLLTVLEHQSRRFRRTERPVAAVPASVSKLCDCGQPATLKTADGWECARCREIESRHGQLR